MRGPLIKNGATLFLVAAALHAAMTACSGGDEDTGRSAEANDATASKIEQSVGQLPGVRTSNATYQDTFDLPGSVQVSAAVIAGTDPEQIRDEIYRVVWESDLDPLDSIRVVISAAGDQTIYSADLDTPTTEQFTEQFGERP